MKGPREPSPDEELHIRAQVKAEIRTRMRAIRRALPAAARDARSAAIAERLAALPAVASAREIAVFHALRGEVDLRDFVARCAAEGKRLALPRVDFESGELVMHRFAPGDPLEEGAYGVYEPRAESEVVPADALDLVVCPALAVDEQGHRIGYGGGYYDRLLARATRAFACAVAFDFQLVAEVPAMPGDVPVSAVVTDQRVLAIPR